ncbi:MAG: hypothetical protein ACQUHE_05860 [Bacteroidia bacterium]
MTDKAKNLLAGALQLVVAFYGAFGSVLQQILPAQIDQKEFIYNYIQIVCVVIFLLIKFVVLKDKTSKFWYWVIGVSFLIFLVAGFKFHQHAKSTLRFVGKSNFKAINGDLSERSKQFCNGDYYKNDPTLKHLSCERAILSISTALDLEWIYTPESVEKNVNKFSLLYVIIALSLSVTVFSLLELIPASSNDSPVPAPATPS